MPQRAPQTTLADDTLIRKQDLPLPLTCLPYLASLTLPPSPMLYPLSRRPPHHPALHPCLTTPLSPLPHPPQHPHLLPVSPASPKPRHPPCLTTPTCQASPLIPRLPACLDSSHYLYYIPLAQVDMITAHYQPLTTAHHFHVIPLSFPCITIH